MQLFEFVFYLALVFVLSNIVFTILIISELQKRKVKINFFLLRLYIPKYVHQYKKITLEETGKVGALFYYWIVSINLTLFLAIIGIVLKISF